MLEAISFDDITALDDDALRTFLDPRDGGVDPSMLGVATAGNPALVDRIARCLPEESALAFLLAARQRRAPQLVERARCIVREQLFWPLVYWTRPTDFEDLVWGERISDRLLDELDLDGRIVCDIGAGTGRFTLAAARRAWRVVAVDMVPAMLQRLQRAASAAGLDNIEMVRGAFRALPLADQSVEVAVACSSFMTTGPHGGPAALREAERIVTSGGSVAIIWPQDPTWLRRHGFEHVRVAGDPCHSFRDEPTAYRLCATYYSDAAAAWVREHHACDVPYSVLGTSPPNDVCIKRRD